MRVTDMLKFWIIMGGLYIIGTIQWIYIFHKLGKEIPSRHKRMWIVGSIAIIICIILAIEGTLD